MESYSIIPSFHKTINGQEWVTFNIVNIEGVNEDYLKRRLNSLSLEQAHEWVDKLTRTYGQPH